MCGCIYGLVRSHTVSHGLVRSRTVLDDRLYDYTRTWHPCQFFKSFKNHTRLSRIHSNGHSVTRIRPRLVWLYVRFIPLFHTGHESPESPRIDFFLFGGIREVSLFFFLQS